MRAYTDETTDSMITIGTQSISPSFAFASFFCSYLCHTGSYSSSFTRSRGYTSTRCRRHWWDHRTWLSLSLLQHPFAVVSLRSRARTCLGVMRWRLISPRSLMIILSNVKTGECRQRSSPCQDDHLSSRANRSSSRFVITWRIIVRIHPLCLPSKTSAFMTMILRSVTTRL